MLMRTHRFGFIGSVPALLLGATLVVGCGDDSSDSEAPVDGGELSADAGETDEGEADEPSSDEGETDETVTDEGESDAGASDETVTDETDAGTSDETTDEDTTTDSGVAPVADSGSQEPVDASDEPTDAVDADVVVPDSGTEPSTDETQATDEVDAAVPNDAGADAGADAAEPSEPEVLDVINEVNHVLVPGVNDLRGLIYSADGQYIYGSGFVAPTADSDRELALVRFLSDGTLDEDFGTAGVVKHNLVTRVVNGDTVTNDGSEDSLGVVQLASGEFVLSAGLRDAAGLGTDLVLVKLDAEGELVSDFGTGGVLRVDLGWTPADDVNFPTAGAKPQDVAWDLRVDNSSGTEKLVIFAFGPAKVGQMTGPVDNQTQRVDNDRYILRVLASDGSLDPEFNAGAPYIMNSGGTFSDGGRRGQVFADGSILSAGYTNFGDGLGNHVMAIRLLPNGTPDPAFGFGIALPGVARTNPFIDDGGIAECYSIGVQSTGRYVTTGYGRATAAGLSSSLGWVTTDAQDLVSVGFTAEGLDTTYGHSGTLAIQSEEYALGGTEDRGRDLLVLPDDRVVHVGRFGIKPAIFVTLPNGEPDLDSGIDGRFEFDALTDPTSHFYKAAFSPDQKRIATTTNNHVDGVLIAVIQVGED
jgi:uncharacterized delta-60 repeat protein